MIKSGAMEFSRLRPSVLLVQVHSKRANYQDFQIFVSLDRLRYWAPYNPSNSSFETEMSYFSIVAFFEVDNFIASKIKLNSIIQQRDNVFSDLSLKRKSHFHTKKDKIMRNRKKTT